MADHYASRTAPVPLSAAGPRDPEGVRMRAPVLLALGSMLMSVASSGPAVPPSSSPAAGAGGPGPAAQTRRPVSPLPGQLEGGYIAVDLVHRAGTVPAAAPPPPAGRLYRIRWGDTLWGLSRRFHVPLTALEAVNHVTAGTVIEAGRDLVIPEEYTVQAGDTLPAIARRFHVPLLLLWHINGLTSDQLTPGQVLTIPYTGQVPDPVYTIPPAPDPPPALPARGLPAAPGLDARDILLLAHLIQAEAGDQPFLGQVAVGAVVLNRLHAPGYPKTVSQVIFAPGQFESVSNGTFWAPPGPSALLAAKAAAAGWDPVPGALYFYNPALTASTWMRDLPVVAEIGQQVFAR
ncbi:putative Gamma-D-glutamyl-meso-diaminopimelate peptidase [Candidatus Hydrogenisulfobacillus filiaventi]|uniref:Putative Gamma-D-glutamyl-meso-diaminopimelate peptidase n=1 Tax=Candidatus Hydrogenisulfobacillus filiaventi TaxID=2707344 RepID=A0A6F8ZGF4_9FIRM|nr:LysM peptidoglycan-binding domain-containing protein [Bacillota bacterium]CAB1128860.1 putative Gamma-D-glutamyl-meso-diaminopimelate peptidase [Candidatus Hydrogenisulfobacillus filiaventi]